MVQLRVSGRLKEASSATIRVLETPGIKGEELEDENSIIASQAKEVCKIEGASVLQGLLNGGSINLSGCALPSNLKNVIVQITNQSGQSLTDGTDGGTAVNALSREISHPDRGDEKHTAAGSVKVALHVLLIKNLDQLLGEENGKQTLPEGCDAFNGSPLVLDMRGADQISEPIHLSAPQNGVFFDILGANARPRAHALKKISWMRDPLVMPIVLPNKNGQVLGIDELFGDNTAGPDGKFADNGFHALAKYDGLSLSGRRAAKPNGVINEQDEVFAQLRLFYDKNSNGVAEDGELITLRRAGIELIDLDYDRSYYSRDAYGNEIKFKSVARTRNGVLRPIFDIWFAVYKKLQVEQ